MNDTVNDEIEINELELFEQMLDLGYDQIEDLPDFILFPTGSYLFNCKGAEIGVNKDKTSGQVKLMFELVDTMELANAELEPPKQGSLFMLTYQGKFGIQKFKKVFGDVWVQQGFASAREFIDNMVNMQFALSMKPKPNKDGKLDPDTQEVICYNDCITATAA